MTPNHVGTKMPFTRWEESISSLQRTRMRAPLSRKPFGAAKRDHVWNLRSLMMLLATLGTLGLSGSEPSAIVVEPSIIKLVSEPKSIQYQGEETSYSCTNAPDLFVGGKAFRWNMCPDGLRVADKNTGRTRVFGLGHVASAAGWPATEGDARLPDSLRGLYSAAGQLWMGSNGEGVVVYTPSTDTWKRYDVTARTVAGFHMQLHYADEDIAFASFGYNVKVPGAAPSLHVYSPREDRWFEVISVPASAASFARCSENCETDTSPHWDRTKYRGLTSISLREAGLTHPSKVEWIQDERVFHIRFYRYAEWEHSVTMLRLTKDSLEDGIRRTH